MFAPLINDLFSLCRESTLHYSGMENVGLEMENFQTGCHLACANRLRTCFRLEHSEEQCVKSDSETMLNCMLHDSKQN